MPFLRNREERPIIRLKMGASSDVTYRILTEPGIPSQLARVSYGGDSFTIADRQNGKPLFEARLSADALTSSSLYSKTGVSFEVRYATGGSRMVGLSFDSEDAAVGFYEWLRGEKLLTPERLLGIIPRENITTLLDLPEYKVTKTLGIVTGINVRSAGPWGNFTAGLQSLIGGSLTSFISLSRDARLQAYEAMVLEAARLGANAILGVRYDSNDVVEGATELMCYGTAVVVEPAGNGS